MKEIAREMREAAIREALYWRNRIWTDGDRDRHFRDLYQIEREAARFWRTEERTVAA